MKKNMLMRIAVVTVFTLSTILIFVSRTDAFPENKIDLVITKIDNKWKVVDVSDSTKTKIKVKKGQKITWTARGTDVFFQFMDEKLTGKFKHSLKDGKSISLYIGNNAKIGVNHYAVFCMANLAFAEGGSPPEIIVE